MVHIKSETETVIKKILPYLNRRGYDTVKDFDFETMSTLTDSYSKGFVDILVTLGKKNAAFLIEAKRISKKLTNKDRDQAISYARAKEIRVPFVVVTNGIDIHCFNTKNKKRILWDGKAIDKIPSRDQISKVLKELKKDPNATYIPISNDTSLPYRPGLTSLDKGTQPFVVCVRVWISKSQIFHSIETCSSVARICEIRPSATCRLSSKSISSHWLR